MWVSNTSARVNALLPQMRNVMRIILAIFATFYFQQAAADLPQTIVKVKRSVVAVATVQQLRSPPINLLGTGFVIGDGQYVVTSAHMLPPLLDKEKKEVLAVLSGQGEKVKIHQAESVLVDTVHDVALLKISEKLPPLSLGNPDEIQEGQTLAFTGFPLGGMVGIYPVTHQGIVSAITPIVMPGRNAQSLDVKVIKALVSPFKVLQLHAVVYPGNSGSPVYHPETGMVYGIIMGTLVKGLKENALPNPSAISYAIPINFVRDLLDKAGVKAVP